MSFSHYFLVPMSNENSLDSFITQTSDKETKIQFFVCVLPDIVELNMMESFLINFVRCMSQITTFCYILSQLLELTITPVRARLYCLYLVSYES